MSVQGSGWAADPHRAAGDRRHYNAMRQLHAERRPTELIGFLAE